MRLLEQFQRLVNGLGGRLDGRGELVELAEVAGLLCCSERHARALLRRMGGLNWLQWSPGQGRGHCSKLAILQTPEALRHEHLQTLLAQGRLEAAFKGLPKAARERLQQSLPAYLGASGAGRLRIPFYRPLHALDPLQVIRRTEAHILKQLCVGLCEYDGQQQAIIPALAHHWESSDDGRSWDFHLRRNLHFHDGRPILAEDAAQSLIRARDTAGPHQALYGHLQSIEGSGQILRLQLSQADFLLLHKLAHHAASVLPAGDSLREDFASLPVGAGPFRIVRNNEYRASLQAFDGYFRERALLDEIDIWVVAADSPMPEVDICHSARLPDKQQWSSVQQLEQGCDFITLNPAQAAFAQPQARLALGAWLREGLASHLGVPDGLLAGGFLPGWQHLPPQAGPLPKLPAQLTLVTYQLDHHIQLAGYVAARLAEQGCRLTVRVLPFPEFAEKDSRSWADMTLSGEVMHEDKALGLYSGLCGASLFELWFDESLRRDIRLAVAEIMQQPDPALAMERMEAAYAQIVQTGSLLPMRHTQQGMHFAPRLGGVRLASCGWMDFRQLWVRTMGDQQ